MIGRDAHYEHGRGSPVNSPFLFEPSGETMMAWLFRPGRRPFSLR
jgi:hypothetical protein